MQLTVVPAPPLVTAQFVAQNNFLCADRPATIAEAVFWARNLEHEYGNTSPADDLNFWQYAGAPPASRVLAGTKYTGTANVVTDLRHWTNGCHSTTGLLKMLLRTLNVPVEHFSIREPVGDRTPGCLLLLLYPCRAALSRGWALDEPRRRPVLPHEFRAR